MTTYDPAAEWLEADGLGGFAMGTVDGVRRRRYHALLLVATTPPTGRMALVNGLEVWLECGGVAAALSSQRYAPDVVYPDGATRLTGFERDPWPTWTYAAPGGASVTQEAFCVRGKGETILWWRSSNAPSPFRLRVRPLLSGRDYHALHHENGAFNFNGVARGGAICWRPYDGVPPIVIASNGAYRADPLWYRNFFYQWEAERGLDANEDLASPGEFVFDLAEDRPAALILRTSAEPIADVMGYAVENTAREMTRRSAAGSERARSALAYRVRRGDGRTLVAGYPWFTDWGRDSFIALRGLILALGDLESAERILAAWAPYVSRGMLPNRFPDRGADPEYNSVDAALWYVVAAFDYFEACEARRRASPGPASAIQSACEAILAGYAEGTRHRIRLDADGLLRAGEPGVQLTWMDAKVGGRVVTPRIGKPVEVQALWANALHAASRWTDHWNSFARRAQAAFCEKFINPAGGLFDVVDVDHAPGRVDAKVRPNQILAVGGLPWALLEGAAARNVVDVVERTLLTPKGLRTLAPDDPDYVGRYVGGPASRDGAYHQGSAWPWLMGPFVDAWLRVRDRSEPAREEARARFLGPLIGSLGEAGLGHLFELADGDAPHTPRGCPFQAWSLGELIRIERMLAVPR